MSKRIDELTFYGICRMLERVFKVPEDTIKIRTRDDAYDVFVQKHDKKPNYPFAYLTFTSGETNTRETRADVPAREGIKSRMVNVGTTDTGVMSTGYQIGVVPYTFNLTFNYVTQDYLDVLTFNARAAFARTKSKLDFDLNFKDGRYPIKVEPEQTVSIPLKSKLGLDAGAYELELGLVISGFVSSPEGEDDFEVPLIREVNLEVRVEDRPTTTET
ncbi:hypothetical protein GR7B_00133 [Vibrio phage vB_VcorM_GR7B]|nr:hypothetical protein GR7B_00133 [Vibrio phage vB_VcorM_GR7B]